MKHVRHPRLASSFALAGAFALGIALDPAAGVRVEAQAAPPSPPVPQPVSSTVTTAPFPASSPAPLPTITFAPPPSGAPASASPGGSPAASPTAAPRGRRGRGRPAPDASASPAANPEPSATPTSPAFSTLDGTWELQLQYIDRTDYSYLTIAQNATGGLSGTWKVLGKPYPFEGTYDGRIIKMTVHEPTGDVTFSGYVEGATDMVGAVDLGTNKGNPTAFTAEHRGSPKSGILRKL